MRTTVWKTRKLYIGGEFPRTESGRSDAVALASGGTVQVSRGSRKDVRNAVAAARSAQPGWWKKTAYNRGQILYRAAEMLDSRAASFEALLVLADGVSRRAAAREVAASVDRFVSAAGWTDKLPMLLGSVNPVAAPFFCFTVPEPVGVVALVAPERPSLLGLVAHLAPILAAGNSVVALLSAASPLPGLELAEVFATSDLPGGVVNLISGSGNELVPHLASHRDVDAIAIPDAPAPLRRAVEEESASNLKRVSAPVFRPDDYYDGGKMARIERLAPFVEAKTTWHPVGI